MALSLREEELFSISHRHIRIKSVAALSPVQTCIIVVMFLVGLTGNYGMGKSTVLRMFGELGAITYDADEIVASLLREEEITRQVAHVLGSGVLKTNGTLDKEKVAHVIFSRAEQREALEDILHPLVFERINKLLSDAGAENGIVVVEVPLLFERKYEGAFQRTITVKTDTKTALERLAKKGIAPNDALVRVKAQLPIEEKEARSDYVIDNSGTLEGTKDQVMTVYRKLLHEAMHGDRRRS